MSVVPPVAEKIPHENEYHGKKYTDNYHWIRDDKRENVKTLEYIKQENAYAESVMEQWKPLQEKLYKEYLSRIQEDDESVPRKEIATDGSVFFYYTRTIKDQNYSLQCRKTGSLEAAEEILLDLNLDKEHKYIELGAFVTSPSHKVFAYSVDYAGHEDYSVRFREISSGKDLPDALEEVTGELEWSSDDKEVLYVKMDSAHRSYQVWKHTMGTPNSEDKLLFEDLDNKYNVSIYKTSTEKFVAIKTSSSKTSEIHILPADDFSAPLKLVQKRIPDVLYSLDHFGEQFVIRTNGAGSSTNVKKVKNFRIAAVPENSPDIGIDSWTEVFASDDVYVTGITTFKNFLVSTERSEGSQRIRVFAPKNGKLSSDTHNEPITFKESDYNVSLRHTCFQDDVLRLQYTSWVTPATVIDVTLATGEQVVKKENPVPNYDKSLYESKVIWSVSDDGVKVPVTLTYKKDLYKGDGTNPCLLYGYGSYGYSMDPNFSVTMFSLLNRGFVYAVAKVRGGTEMGRAWYEDQGKFLTKMNTFTDFVAAGRTLVRQNVTTHERMAISGASAGGLLVGAVLNLAPDLCSVYVSNVPFVDVINTMWDETIPLTTGEFEEWGNPKDKEYFEYMYKYSPYDNIKPGVKYPNGRITAGLWDPRVAYWEPTKYVAKMRELDVTRGDKKDEDPNLLIFDCQLNAGHFASTGRYDYLKDKAKDMAFIIGKLNAPQDI